MVKRVYTIAVLLLAVLTMGAAPVSEKQALQQARAFLSGRGMMRKLQAKDGQNVLCKAEVASNNYFVFNAGTNQGYVIVSADDATEPILGYTVSGAFDKDNLPVQLREMLAQYDNIISSVGKQSVAKSPYVPPTQTVAPLMSSEWGQGYPYNMLCPLDGDSRSVTGCVATAMAQIMRYKRWPEGTTAALDAYSRGSISVDALPATTFDWDNMLDRYDYPSYGTETQRQAVAKLMQYCGSSVHMQYSSKGSGSFSFDVPNALTNDFGYSKNVRLVKPESYTMADWDAMMVNELSNQRPVLLTGVSMAVGGHAFVCDGYDGNGLYYIDWGWNGVDNGFYRLSFLNPQRRGYMFNVFQDAVVGIQKPLANEEQTDNKHLFGGRVDVYCDTLLTRSSSAEAFNIDNGYGVSCLTAFTGESTEGSLQVAMAELDGNDNVTTVYGENSIYMRLGSNDNLIASAFNLGQGETSGHKKLYMVYRFDDSESWQLLNDSKEFYVDATFDETTLHIHGMPEPRLRITGTRIDKNIDAEGSQRLTYFVTNEGDNFRGYIYFISVGSGIDDSGLKNLSFVSVAAGANDSIQFTEPANSLTTENDNYVLVADAAGNYMIYSNMNVENSQLQGSVTVTNADENNKIMDNKVLATITLTNSGAGVYNNLLAVMAVEKDASPDDVEFNGVTQKVKVEAGDTQEISVSVPCTTYGKDMKLIIDYLNPDLSDGYVESTVFRMVKGIKVWNAQGKEYSIENTSTTISAPDTAVVVDFQSSNARTIKQNSNPNSIYVMTKKLKGATSNFVGSQHTSAKLTLQDGYDYYVPFSIFCQQMSYTRTVAPFAWTTMVLPFTPSSVVDAAGNEVALKQSADDAASLAVLEPQAVSGNSVSCTFASAIQAGKVYIVGLANETTPLQLTFSAAKDSIYATSFDAIGGWQPFNYAGTAQQVYTINGNSLVLQPSAAVEPFRAYLLSNGYAGELSLETPVSLPTSIREVNAGDGADEAYYSLQGVRTMHPQRGVYIYKGKKVVLK